MNEEDGKVRIVADDWENADGVIGALRGIAEVEQRRLGIGDFVVEEKIVVERMRAERLLERFRSVENVPKATTDELAGIDGIGESTAARIRWVGGEPP